MPLPESLLLLFDGRYRDIPEFDFALPVGGLLAMAAIRLTLARHPGESWREALALRRDVPRPLFPQPHSAARLADAAMVPLSLIGEAWALGTAATSSSPTRPSRTSYPICSMGLVWNARWTFGRPCSFYWLYRSCWPGRQQRRQSLLEDADAGRGHRQIGLVQRRHSFFTSFCAA